MVYGIEHTEFGKTFFEGYDFIDVELAEEEMAKVTRKMIEENPDHGAIVLECTNMPPFTKAIQEASGLPVFGIVNLIKYVYEAIV